MGLRYRGSIRLGRGLRINLSKSGASLSVGGRGATVNLGRHGIRTTVGLPGSGLSYSETKPWHQGAGERTTSLAPRRRGSAIIGWIILLIAVAAIAVLLGR